VSSVYEALQRARQAGQGPAHAPPRPASPRSSAPREPVAPPITRSPGPLAPALNPLLAALRPMLGGETGVLLHVVAAMPGEGASTIAGEFALLAATTGHCRTALIDADMRSLASARAFECETGRGLIDARADFREPGVMREVAGSLLSVACLFGEGTAGHSDGNALRAVYDRLRTEFELSVIDCPAFGTGDYLALAPEAADGVILVVQAEATRPAVVAHAKAQVEQAGGKLLGAVLNRRHNYIPEFLYRML
jgi:Mrp family chromosome partitioning ATPase